MTPFSLRAALMRTFSLIGGSLSSVGVFIIATQLTMTVIQFAILRPTMMGATANPAAPLQLFSSPGYWLGVALGTALFGFIFAGSIHGLLLTAEGKRATLADCVRGGISKALPVVGLSILWMLGVWAGMMLFFIPGIILMTMWAVCLPVLVEGEAGVFGSFGRSRELTKGCRLKIFMLLLLFVAVYYSLMLTVMGGAIFSARPNVMSATMAASMTSAFIAGSLIITTIVVLVLPALLTAIYLEAERARYGSRTGTVAEVFA